MKKLLAFALLPMLLAACSDDAANSTGGLAQSESDALNDAADMLDKADAEMTAAAKAGAK